MMPEGFLLIDKPLGITSFDCIRHIKKILKIKTKMSHMGTLDPFASGLLIIAIGKSATSQSEKFINMEKEYEAKAQIGILTDTLDCTGKIIKKCKTSIKNSDLINAIKSLSDTYKQTPPIFSALKYKGKPLYKIARENLLSKENLEKIIKEKTKTVKLYKIILKEFDLPYFSILAKVSAGTYIRSLMNDIAKGAGSCATTNQLIRTKIGKYSIDEAISLKKIQSIEDINVNLKKDL